MVLADPEPPAAGQEVAATVLLPRHVIADPDQYRTAIAGMTSAGRVFLAEALGREPLRCTTRIGLLYGALTDAGGQRIRFRPMACPEATHARVTVRLIEETK